MTGKIPPMILLLVIVVGLGGGVAAQMQDVNLLTNPSFEEPYAPWNGINELKVPRGWQPWWSEYPRDEAWQNMRPEFDRSSVFQGYGYRVHEGNTALRYFKMFSTFTAGVYQVVEGVAPGVTLEFSVWGHAWSCSDWAICHEQQADGSYKVWSEPESANVVLRAGIDPTGGVDPFGANVVWSPSIRALDSYRQFTVLAVAQSSRVTVFTYAWQKWAAHNQDAYWDDASLMVVDAQPPAITQRPPDTPPPPPVPTANLKMQGTSDIHTARSGDTLSSIAYQYQMFVADLRALIGLLCNEPTYGEVVK